MSGGGRSDPPRGRYGSSGPMFRLANIPRNLSIAPPVRVAPVHRTTPNPRLCSPPHTRPTTSSSSSSSSTLPLHGKKNPSVAPKSSKKPPVHASRSLSPSVKRKINPVLDPPTAVVKIEIPSNGRKNMQSTTAPRAAPKAVQAPKPTPAPVRAAPPFKASAVSSSGMTTRGGGGGGVSHRSISPRSTSPRASAVKNTSPRSAVNTSPRSTRSNSKPSGVGLRDDSKEKGHVSEMKPKTSSRNANRQKNKSDGCVTADPEEFWEALGTEQWAPVSVEDLHTLRGLQEEQYDGYQHFISENSDHGGLQCFQQSFSIPIPAPVEATRTVALSTSFSFQLASRGSADDVFWNNVIETMINESSSDHTVGGRECGAQSCPATSSSSSLSASPSTSIPASDASFVEKSSVQTYIDIHNTKSKAILDAVCENRTNLDQNIYMFPKPLPSFSHLAPPPERRASAGNNEVDRGSIATRDVKSVLDVGNGGVLGCHAMQPDVPTFDAKVFRNRNLGKRGRLYDEVWDEEDYLQKKSTLIEICNSSPHIIPFRSTAVTNWNELLNHYSDDHDGVYVDYLLDKALARKKQIKNDEIYNMKKEGDRLKLNLKRDEGILSLFSPPVPVSCHHPASWGRHTHHRGPVTSSKRIADPTMGLDIDRKKRCNGSSNSTCSSESEEEGFDPNRWHPACYTSETVMPVAYCSTSRQKSRNNSSHVVAGGEDTDELNLLLDSLLNELAVQSASNFMMLSNLTKSVGMELNLQSMRKQHSDLEDAHIQVSNFFVKADEDIRNAAAKASLQQQRKQQQSRENVKPGDDQCDGKSSPRKSKRIRIALADPLCSLSSSTSNQEPPPGYSSESACNSKTTTKPPAVNGSSIQSKLFRHKKRKDIYREQPSRVEMCQSRESFRSTLREGDLVEVRSTCGVWSLCMVEQCRTDSSGGKRLIQVRAVDSCGSDVQWASLEDDVLAEPGTNVPPFIVDEARDMLP